MELFKITLLITTIFLTLSSNGWSEWATGDDADYAVDSENIVLEVNKDGTSQTRYDRTLEILKESARMSMGVSHYLYDPNAETFKLLKAQTINGSTVLPVPSQFIEDKPIASDIDGFDTRNQVTVAFPDVKVGSKIHEVYWEGVTKLGIPNFFSKRLYFGVMEYLKARHLEIHSKIPLFLQVNDPQGRLEVTSSADKKSYEINLKTALFTKVIHEKNSVVDEKKKTWIVVANSNDFAQVFKPLAKKFEAVISEPLPEAYQNIVNDAAKEKTSVDKINVVTSRLADLVRYVGDWREVEGAYAPHSLAVIAKNKFGDCKDFSVSTAAMLRNLGMKAEALALERGRLPTPWPLLPLLSAANHAMVKVEAGGKIFWIDPTNFQSYAQGIFDDVSNRSALVLNPQNVHMEQIPLQSPTESLVRTEMTMNFFKNGDVSLDGYLNLLGRSAVPVTGASLFARQEELSYQLATSFFPDQDLKTYKVDGLNLTSRITKDLRFNVQLSAKNTSIKTTAGYGMRMPSSGIVTVLSDIDLRTRVSDLVLDNPSTMQFTYRLKNVKIVGNKLSECNLKSPWLNASFQFKRGAAQAEVTNTFTTKVAVIPIETLQTRQFENFQSQFRDCFDNTALVYLPLGRQVKLRSLTSTN